jgi:hypothetical protein
MNQEHLAHALTLVGNPAVSIYAPTHTSAPENQADRIVVKNLVVSAQEQISDLGPARDYTDLSENLEKAFQAVDWNSSSAGICLLVSADGHWKFDLDHAPVARVNVSSSFDIADLAKAASQSREYNLLVLSESPTRLFSGNGSVLQEITAGFPIVHTGLGGEQGKPTGFGKQTSVILNEEHRKFFREIAAALTKFKADEANQAPLVITGVDRYLAFWADVAPEHQPAVVVLGSYDFKSEAELSSKVWPTVSDYFDQQNLLVLESLDKARSAKSYAGGHSEVMEKAREGRIQLLVVADEEIPNPETEAIIRESLDKGTEVRFVPGSSLADYAPIAAALRF